MYIDGKLWQPWMARAYSVTPPILGGMVAEQVEAMFSDAEATGLIKRG